MPRSAVLAVVVVASMAFSLVGCGAPDGSRADQASIDRMIDTVKATRDGERIDLGDILDGPWDRAVLMEPYLDGAAMNDRLGFEGYAPDAVSQQDEAAEFVVFVVDRIRHRRHGALRYRVPIRRIDHRVRSHRQHVRGQTSALGYRPHAAMTAEGEIAGAQVPPPAVSNSEKSVCHSRLRRDGASTS